MSDVERMVSAADRIESAAHRMALLFEDGYGGAGVRLLEAVETDVADLRAKLQAAEAGVGRTVDALGFLQGTAPAAFLGRHLAEYAAHLIKDLRASNTRLRGALEGIGVLPDGYCFCFNSYRDANKPEHEHTGECREARAALEGRK